MPPAVPMPPCDAPDDALEPAAPSQLAEQPRSTGATGGATEETSPPRACFSGTRKAPSGTGASLGKSRQESWQPAILNSRLLAAGFITLELR